MRYKHPKIVDRFLPTFILRIYWTIRQWYRRRWLQKNPKVRDALITLLLEGKGQKSIEAEQFLKQYE